MPTGKDGEYRAVRRSTTEPQSGLDMKIPPGLIQFAVFVAIVFALWWSKQNWLRKVEQAAAPPPVAEPIDHLRQPISDFIAAFPELEIGLPLEVKPLDNWAKGERRMVGTFSETYIFYFNGTRVVGVRKQGNSQREDEQIFLRE